MSDTLLLLVIAAIAVLVGSVMWWWMDRQDRRHDAEWEQRPIRGACEPCGIRFADVEDLAVHVRLEHRGRPLGPEDSPEWGRL